MTNDDELQVEILEDGTVKISSDLVSQANHATADKLLSELARMLGGSVTVRRKAQHNVQPTGQKATQK